MPSLETATHNVEVSSSQDLVRWALTLWAIGKSQRQNKTRAAAWW